MHNKLIAAKILQKNVVKVSNEGC